MATLPVGVRWGVLPKGQGCNRKDGIVVMRLAWDSRDLHSIPGHPISTLSLEPPNQVTQAGILECLLKKNPTLSVFVPQFTTGKMTILLCLIWWGEDNFIKSCKVP